jgi:hypothetical protein
MRDIRTLRLDEIETLVNWAAAEGWNPGIGDASAFQAADPNGFLGAFVDDEMVAGISAVAYGADFGFIGLYICRPDRRGQGHGKAVWDAGMARLAGHTIGLDGVAEQQANYASMGFARAYETVRMSGIFAGTPAGERFAPEQFEAVARFDASGFPAPRRNFIDAWTRPPRQALVTMHGGDVAGFGVVRQCVEGQKIGPLFAASEAVAEGLLGALSQSVGGPVQLDVPAHQEGFMRQLEASGFTPGFTTARMYRGPRPLIDDSRVFAISTLELG